MALQSETCRFALQGFFKNKNEVVEMSKESFKMSMFSELLLLGLEKRKSDFEAAINDPNPDPEKQFVAAILLLQHLNNAVQFCVSGMMVNEVGGTVKNFEPRYPTGTDSIFLDHKHRELVLEIDTFFFKNSNGTFKEAFGSSKVMAELSNRDWKQERVRRNLQISNLRLQRAKENFEKLALQLQGLTLEMSGVSPAITAKVSELKEEVEELSKLY